MSPDLEKSGEAKQTRTMGLTTPSFFVVIKQENILLIGYREVEV